MKIQIIIDVPQAFIDDQYFCAALDAEQGLTPIPFPAHSAIRSLIQDGPIRLTVDSVTLPMGDRIVKVDYSPTASNRI